MKSRLIATNVLFLILLGAGAATRPGTLHISAKDLTSTVAKFGETSSETKQDGTPIQFIRFKDDAGLYAMVTASGDVSDLSDVSILTCVFDDKDRLAKSMVIQREIVGAFSPNDDAFLSKCKTAALNLTKDKDRTERFDVGDASVVMTAMQGADGLQIMTVIKPKK